MDKQPEFYKPFFILAVILALLSAAPGDALAAGTNSGTERI